VKRVKRRPCRARGASDHLSLSREEIDESSAKCGGGRPRNAVLTGLRLINVLPSPFFVFFGRSQRGGD